MTRIALHLFSRSSRLSHSIDNCFSVSDEDIDLLDSLNLKSECTFNYKKNRMMVEPPNVKYVRNSLMRVISLIAHMLSPESHVTYPTA